jgi:hypothetical protein
MGKEPGTPHLEQERVLADALDWGQQVALQWDIRGLPASQKHATLQRDRRPLLTLAKDGRESGYPLIAMGNSLSADTDEHLGSNWEVKRAYHTAQHKTH